MEDHGRDPDEEHWKEIYGILHTKHLVPRIGDYCLWGEIDNIEKINKYILSISTPCHGGYWLSPRLNELIPIEVRNYRWYFETDNADIPLKDRKFGGYYEEDCEWSKVVFFFPEYFSKESLQEAIETIKSGWVKGTYAEMKNYKKEIDKIKKSVYKL